jgi:hypothetical protein
MHTFARVFHSTLLRLVTAGALSITASFAHATFINFDDIPYVLEEDEPGNFYDVPLTDQYADKGLIVDNGYILPYLSEDGTALQSNYLLGGNVLTFIFTGDLPTVVSMYVTSLYQDSIFLNAYNSSGLVQELRTKGTHGEWGTPDYEEESPPNQFVSFNVEAGISRITIENYYNTRVSARIDDLTFTRNASVPEPSSVLLLVLGLCVLAWRRFVLKSNFFNCKIKQITRIFN